jgi:Fur family transcriptional regulator, ferric uptake regulator
MPTGEDVPIIEPLCAVFRRKLRGEGLKYTPERAQVLDAILRFEGLFEADQVLKAARASGLRVSKATVYRTIRLLQDAGIIQRVLFDEDHGHYQVIYGQSPQDLLFRLDGGPPVPINVPELIALRERVCQSLGLVPKGHRLHIFAAKS